MSLELTKADKSNLFYAMIMWANYIETGDVNVSGTEAHAYNIVPRILDDQAKQKVIKLRALASRVLNS